MLSKAVTIESYELQDEMSEGTEDNELCALIELELEDGRVSITAGDNLNVIITT